jgi:hypothetical protein
MTAGWRNLSARDWRDTVLALALIPIAHVTLRAIGAHRTLRRVERRSAPRADDAGKATAIEASRLATAVRRAAGRGPFAGNCLSRSTALLWLLRRHGLDGDIRFGARTGHGRLEAHAWVVHEGRALNDSDEIEDHYAPLTPEHHGPPAAGYSERSARAGSVDAALRDGHQTAKSPAVANAASAAASETGSRGVTPNN